MVGFSTFQKHFIKMVPVSGNQKKNSKTEENTILARNLKHLETITMRLQPSLFRHPAVFFLHHRVDSSGRFPANYTWEAGGLQSNVEAWRNNTDLEKLFPRLPNTLLGGIWTPKTYLKHLLRKYLEALGVVKNKSVRHQIPSISWLSNEWYLLRNLTEINVSLIEQINPCPCLTREDMSTRL